MRPLPTSTTKLKRRSRSCTGCFRTARLLMVVRQAFAEPCIISRVSLGVRDATADRASATKRSRRLSRSSRRLIPNCLALSLGGSRFAKTSGSLADRRMLSVALFPSLGLKTANGISTRALHPDAIWDMAQPPSRRSRKLSRWITLLNSLNKKSLSFPACLQGWLRS